MAATRIFVVELRCLACGREHEITIGALVDLPTLPERCTHCGGSVLATSSSTRSVRVERPVSSHDWLALMMSTHSCEWVIAMRCPPSRMY